MQLEGRAALVTGAGQGVGRGIALALAAEGCAVAVAGRTGSKLRDVCGEIAGRGGAAVPVVCDVTHPEQIEACVEAVVERLGGLDVLVNNAQIVPLGTLLEVSDEDVEAGWRSGPLATLRLMRACHPHLRGGGSIVNLGTGAALRPDPVGYGAYAAVKEAIRALTRAACRSRRRPLSRPGPSRVPRSRRRSCAASRSAAVATARRTSGARSSPSSGRRFAT
jgi:NAD(P)-dependent dehydrogenase (short-subunit alcohol dehydrogenase family)